MRRVDEPPIEVLIALRSRWARTAVGEDGLLVKQVGRWLGIFTVEEGEDEDGDDLPFFSGMRVFVSVDELEAIEVFEHLVAEGVS